MQGASGPKVLIEERLESKRSEPDLSSFKFIVLSCVVRFSGQRERSNVGYWTGTMGKSKTLAASLVQRGAQVPDVLPEARYDLSPQLENQSGNVARGKQPVITGCCEKLRHLDSQ